SMPSLVKKPPLPPTPVLRPINNLPDPPRFKIEPIKNPEEYKEKLTGYKSATELEKLQPKPQITIPEIPQQINGRLVSSRKKFFENLQDTKHSSSSIKALSDDAARRIDQFKSSAQEARDILNRSTPDLVALEA